jgi:DNA-binding GntR family transcriptional regulator
VITRSGHAHTVQVWRSIWPRIRGYFYRYGRRRHLKVIADEHRELLAALQSRDPAVVLEVLERHIAVPTAPEAADATAGRGA